MHFERIKKEEIKKFFLKHKRKIGIGVIGILLVIVFLSIFQKGYGNGLVTDETPGVKQNTNSTFLEDKEADGLVFKKIKCTFDGSNSLLTYIIVNNTKETIHLNEYELIVKDKNKQILTVITPNLDKEIQPKEELSISNEVNIDITDAYYLSLNLIK